MHFEKLIEQQNQKIEASYLKTLEIIKTSWEKLKDKSGEYDRFLFQIADKILCFAELESEFTPQFYQNNSLKDLQRMNRDFFTEVNKENYAQSYANPKYCERIFGAERGAFLASYYTNYRRYLGFAFAHQRFYMEKWNRLFIDIFDLLQTDKAETEDLKKLTTRLLAEPVESETLLYFAKHYHPQSDSVKQIVMHADLNDIRYLYQYGQNITDNELKTAEFLQRFSPQKIDELAAAIMQAFLRSYKLAKKDISGKKSIAVFYHLGQEALARSLVQKFAAEGLNAIMPSVFTTHPNKQYRYDHRFDHALYLDEEYVQKLKQIQTLAAEKYSIFLQEYAGPIFFDSFGEKPFSPQANNACLKLNEQQQQLAQKQSMNFSQLVQKYMPRSQNSFCIVGFPLPEIGSDFEAIFAETIGINMMDTIKHEKIQQFIIDVLDKAEFVLVKGKNGNLTDIKVKMHKLSDPAVQTNFVNCGAEVNIPVGEVFTSPVLKGTDGVLHLKETFLKGLRFIDLNLKFKDGYVIDYNCANFDDEQENKKYIEENLLFPHKTLPIGEFAIGTNTKAYMMAQKYDILPLLPVLIVEKMGPHFAIGDTCFSWEEDFAVHNPLDNKEIIARENEHSARRKTDVAKAYTNCHTDITLPYEDLDFITAVAENGDKYEIIRNGRFVVKGCEDLNIPLNQQKS